ncbi:MFS transporter [Algimonas arctica]|uniref:MFS transporter n=1 Tax=Algimonas arctica TaxID=1479486 RepID=A0A8J3G300_9PROT|nr:MFS transporter [Algimonas arctica]GHA98017.1 MFS transporter [Algimonas arctica]
MRSVLSSVGALLISAAVLLAGGGLLGTLIAVRAELEGFPLLAIGLMSSAYFAGFVVGCVFTPMLVKRVGHVRVFAALSSLIASCVLMHVLFVNVPVWVILRFATGLGFAGLYILIESWINEQAPNEKRGQILSIYRMVDLAAITTGQFMLSLYDPSDFALFSVVAICVCLAIFPISLSSSKAPIAVTNTSLNLKKLVRMSPLAVVGAFAVGLTNGSFWGMAPVFVQLLGHPIVMVSLFMSVTIASGAILQWPVGYLSDKFGRRQILILMAVGAVAAGGFLNYFATTSGIFLLTGGALYGVFAFQIYGLSAAHANDRAEPTEFVAISGGLLLVYGVGSVIGPSIAPLIMSAFGPSAMFAFTAFVHALLVVYAMFRVSQRAAPDESADYVTMPRPLSMALILRTDPRNIIKRKRKLFRDR